MTNYRVATLKAARHAELVSASVDFGIPFQVNLLVESTMVQMLKQVQHDAKWDGSYV